MSISGWCGIEDVFDANHKVGRLPMNRAGGSLEQRVAVMDRIGIAEALVSSVTAIYHAPAAGNKELSRAINGNPRLAACWVGLPPGCGELPSLERWVGEAEQAGVAAVRVYPSGHGWSLTSVEGMSLLAAVTAAGMPILVDSDEVSWADLERVANAIDGAKLIVCEVGYRRLREAAGPLSRQDGLLVDLSYLGGHQALEWLVTEFGAHRVVFGTGAPGCDPAGAMGRLMWSGLDVSEIKLVAGGTMRALLGRGDAA